MRIWWPASIILLAVVLIGLAYIVTPAAGREMATRLGRVALALFVIGVTLSYLWADRMGRLLLGAAAVLIIARLRGKS